MNAKKRGLISLLVGLVLALAVYALMHRHEKKANAQKNRVPVLVARRYVAPGQVVRREDTETRFLPEAYREPLALSSLGEDVFMTRSGLLKGAQITNANATRQKDALALAWTLAPDETALTLRLSLENGVGGFLQPGDRVAVMATVDRQPGWDETSTVAVVGSARVLGINGSTLMTISQKDVPNDFILVTLAVTLQHAARLALAAEKSRVSLVLLSPLAQEPMTTPPVRLRHLTP